MPWTQHSAAFLITSCTQSSGGTRPAAAATSSAVLWGRQYVHVADQTCKRIAPGSKLLVLRHRWFWESVWYRLLPKKKKKNTLSIIIENYWLDAELNVYNRNWRIFQENVRSIVTALSSEPFPNYCTFLCPIPVAKGRRVWSANEVSWFCIVLLTHKGNGQIRSWECFSDIDFRLRTLFTCWLNAGMFTVL